MSNLENNLILFGGSYSKLFMYTPRIVIIILIIIIIFLFFNKKENFITRKTLTNQDERSFFRNYNGQSIYNPFLSM